MLWQQKVVSPFPSFAHRHRPGNCGRRKENLASDSAGHSRNVLNPTTEPQSYSPFDDVSNSTNHATFSHKNPILRKSRMHFSSRSAHAGVVFFIRWVTGLAQKYSGGVPKPLTRTTFGAVAEYRSPEWIFPSACVKKNQATSILTRTNWIGHSAKIHF